jgi:RNA polymerase sigma-70 factor (ECF subfamily)
MATRRSRMDGASASRHESTSRELLDRARRGDADALARVMERCLPRLHRWAHRRLARWVRTAADTTDIVHDAVLGTVRQFSGFEPRGRQALSAYLRAAVQNRIRDEHRRFKRRGVPIPAAEALVDRGPSPFESAAASEARTRYRTALARLSLADRRLIVAHVDLGYSHAQIGCMTGRTPNAARMALQRAVHRLAELMRDV